MTDRVSIAVLRESPWLAVPDDVLALVDAVEAAHAAARREKESCPHHSAHECVACQTEIYEARLAAWDKLARFSFDAEPPNETEA